MKKWSREVEGRAARYGFVLVRQGKHLIFRHTTTGAQVAVPSTPHCEQLSRKRSEADFRRYGTPPSHE